MKETIQINADTIIQREIEQQFASINDEIMMLDINNGTYYSLNEIASKIWVLLERPLKVSEIISSLLEEYKVSKEECMIDTNKYLSELRAKGLIKLLE